MKKVVTATMLVGVLAGCTTLDPYSREEKTANATKGAGIGAVSGALLGAAVSSRKDRGKGALIGALVGGAVGGGVGAYMDKQEMELRQQLDGTGVGVERVGDDIRLIMPGNITFQTGSAQLDTGFYPVLDDVALVLNKFKDSAVGVNGYTDSTGSFEFNQSLSEQRAASVASYLASRGVSQMRLTTQGYGPRYPVADNGSAAGRAQNRRVEVYIRGTAS
ncbi:OmpA family protein [Marinobacterium rhizophilum]|uniref:OmpA family protein n=1 Tax=Marinobacterium rhizophilum TaxID=420402 RepID=UPI000477F611|nr:OmpA family protein [Marinobacterium rhizophilum]